MPAIQQRRLLQKTDLISILQLAEPKVQWLIDTRQICERRSKNRPQNAA